MQPRSKSWRSRSKGAFERSVCCRLLIDWSQSDYRSRSIHSICFYVPHQYLLLSIARHGLEIPSQRRDHMTSIVHYCHLRTHLFSTHFPKTRTQRLKRWTAAWAVSPTHSALLWITLQIVFTRYRDIAIWRTVWHAVH